MNRITYLLFWGLFWSFALTLAYVIICAYVAGLRADEALRLGAPTRYATFERGELYNSSTASAGSLVKVTKRDYNKSRIIGAWAGEKSKEFGSGFIEGLKQKSKHE